MWALVVGINNLKKYQEVNAEEREGTGGPDLVDTGDCEERDGMDSSMDLGYNSMANETAVDNVVIDQSIDADTYDNQPLNSTSTNTEDAPDETDKDDASSNDSTSESCDDNEESAFFDAQSDLNCEATGEGSPVILGKSILRLFESREFSCVTKYKCRWNASARFARQYTHQESLGMRGALQQ